MSFYALQVSSEQIYHTEGPDKFIWTKLEEKTFAFAAEWSEDFGSKDIAWVDRPKTQNVSNGPGYKILMGRIHCLYNNVIYPLYTATN